MPSCSLGIKPCFYAGMTSEWNICPKVAHAAHFSPSRWWTSLHTEPDCPPPSRMDQPYRLAQSKRACLEQVYLIPGVNWIHLKIQGQLVINCYPKKSTLLSCHRRRCLRRERPGAGRVTIRRVSNPRRSREVHFGSSGERSWIWALAVFSCAPLDHEWPPGTSI